MKPLAHQEKFVKGYSGPRLIVHEGGTGKTVCACLWLADGRDADALVVCPKKVIKKWMLALKAWGTKATVVSSSQFSKMKKKNWSAKVIDEADEFAAPLFIAKSQSQMGTSMYEFTKEYPDIPTLLLTATPIRSTPWNLHTLLCFIGEYIDWKVWRAKFFYLQMPDNFQFRYLSRPAYMPRPNWRQLIRVELEKYADIVLMRDIAELPPVTEQTIKIENPKYIMKEDDKPFFSEHRHEQQNKITEIMEAGREFRKVLVVAYYREQIEELQKALKKDDKEVFAINGGVEDQEAVIEAANASDDCYFIVQASIGAGFDADTFSCLVFASMSYAVRDFVQMKFRVRRVHNLQPLEIRYLIGGRCDKGVMDNIIKGKDFVPSEWK